MTGLSAEEKWKRLVDFYAVDWVLFARFLKSIGAAIENFIRFHQSSFPSKESNTAREYLLHMLPSHEIAFGAKSTVKEAGEKRAQSILTACVARSFTGAGSLRIVEEEVCRNLNVFLKVQAKRHGWSGSVIKNNTTCEIIIDEPSSKEYDSNER